MALSNIFNEPRREITETLVGVAIVIVPIVVFGYLDYEFAVQLKAAASNPNKSMPIPLGMSLGALLGALALIVSAGIAVGVHAVGESFCDAMQRRGIHLRPRRD